MLRRVWALRKLQAECSCEFQLKHTEALNGIWAQLDTRDWTMKSTDFCASWKCCRLPLVVWVGGVWRWRELLKSCCTPQSWGTYIIYAYIEIDEGWWQSIQFWWRSFDFILSHLPSITPSYSLHVIQSHCALIKSLTVDGTAQLRVRLFTTHSNSKDLYLCSLNLSSLNVS